MTCYECDQCGTHLRIPDGVSLVALPHCDDCERFLDETEPCPIEDGRDSP